MLNETLAAFYERDLRKLIDEISLFENDADLWRTAGTISNPAGNLVLHLTGGMNHHIGAKLGHTGYVRSRDLEFSQKNVPREQLISEVERLINVIRQTLAGLTQQQLDADFPAFFDQPGTSTAYVLIQLLAHLNYHLGQVNYLRRMLNDRPLP